MSHIQALTATILLFLHLPLLTLIQSTTSDSFGFSLKLIPIDSPESPFYFGNRSQSENIHQLVESKARINKFSSENMSFPLSYDNPSYVVKLQIGTPDIPLFLEMQTGSALTWTQCQPCEKCYHQVPPIYDSRTSNTYGEIPCNHPVCLSNPNLFKCIGQKCIFGQVYTSGGLTRGIASEEIFQLLPNNHTSIIFGCSKYNINFPFEVTGGKIAGILGLGLGTESLVQQLGNVINHRFSYCLVPLNRAAMATSYLRFGNDIVSHGRSFQSTPIVTPPGQSDYYLNLIDISVNGHRLGFQPGTFSIAIDGTGGCIVDSTITVTLIHLNAYQRVMTAFENYFARFRLQRFPFIYKGLNLCYLYNRNFEAYASMTFHFHGADLVVPPEHVYLFEHDRLFCLALVPSGKRSVLGALHQQNVRLIYDTKNRIIHFAPENCMLDAH